MLSQNKLNGVREGSHDGKEDGKDILASFSYDGPGISGTRAISIGTNHSIYTIRLGEPLKSYDEKTYTCLTVNAIQEYIENTDQIRRDKSKSKEEAKDDLEFEFLCLVDKLGIINDHVRLPVEKRVPHSGTLSTISKIAEKGVVTVGRNSYLVAGSLNTFDRLAEKGVLSGHDIEIKIGDGVNIQENMGVLKLIESNEDRTDKALKRFEKGDILSNLHIDLQNNTSIAHGVSICAKFNKETGHFEANVHTGEGVFLGINSIIGSGSRFDDNSVVWFGSKIDYNVKIGKNTIIGKGAKIKENLTIPDNCLILDGSNISKGYKIIPFEEYIKDEIKFDARETNHKGRRSFVLQMSSCPKERKRQLQRAGEIYLAMDRFNKHNVTPENKTFAVIDAALLFLHEKYPDLNIIKMISGTNTKSDETIRSVTGLYKNRQVQRKYETLLQAYPKNKEEFLRNLKRIYEMIREGDAGTEEIIRSNLDFPIIEGCPDNLFLGKNCLIGNVTIGGHEDNLIADSFIREDENTTDNVSYHDNVRCVRCTLHGPGRKNIENATFLSTCIHGEIMVENVKAGSLRHPSIINNSKITDTTISGRFNCNYGIINDSKIGFGVTISGQNDKEVIVSNTRIGKSTIIRPGNIFESCDIGENTFIGESPGNTSTKRSGEYIEGKLMKMPMRFNP